MIRFKKGSFFILLVFFMCSSFSCSNKSIRELLLDHYSSEKDSLKYEAALFLLDNMNSQISEIPTIIDKSNGISKIIDFKKDDIEQLKHLIYSNKTALISVNVPDSQLISIDYLINNIDFSFSTWNKYAWSKSVPKDIFFEYILPYKILNEPLSSWREELNLAYLNDELLINAPYDENDVYYKTVVDWMGHEYKYNPSPLKFSKYSGYDEMKSIKQIECFNGSYIGVYALRALGIPAAVDFIPLWGSRNAGHATEVFWDSDSSCFRTAQGRDLQSRYPAKVYRFTFKNSGLWSNKIHPVTNNDPFLLDFLRHDHWIDVTHEHTKTISFTYKMPFDIEVPFAYICVYNYGDWQPVYWGSINGNEVVFENMGCNMLYRIAIPKGNGFELISGIYKIDNEGIVQEQINRTTEKRILNLYKINHGEESWLSSGRKYQLLYWDKNDTWTLLEEKDCKRDSFLVFENVPDGVLYKLVDTSSSIRRERIFSYDSGEQVWW